MKLAARRPALGVIAVSIALLTGCGSTVEMGATQEQAVGSTDDGLSVPSQAVPQTGTGTTPDETSTGRGLGADTGSNPTPTAGRQDSAGPDGVQRAPTRSGGKPGASRSPRQTGPLTVGFIISGTSNAASTGASLGNTISETGVDTALVNALNKKGGIAGRQLKAVFAHTDTGASNWSNDFQAACATFTQDHQVAAVLGYQFTYEPNLESCLAKKGIPHLSNGFNVPSNSVLAQYPLFWSLDVPTIGVRSLAKFEGAIKTGFLTPQDKLGIVLDNCPGTLSAWKGEVRPYLAAHHINVALEYTTSCGTGNNAGTAAIVSGVTSALLKFHSAGVNRISFVMVSEAPALYIITTVAQTQGYYPGWIVSSLAQLAIIGGEAPKAEMRNTHGYGWLPSQDVPPTYNPKPNASQRRCVSLLRSQGVKPRSAADFGYAYNACEAVFLYEKALELTGADPDGAAVSSAIASIGGGFESMLNLNGRSTFSNARRNNAPAFYKPINWDGNCSCFRYGRQTYAMP
ncbi:MAG TPA: hypothetical protein VHA79_08740 [Mycobacteriales bacterium]|jgi:hypothetical protein|nr:hypothetical protein [Mycobacteriales bacterium]